MIESAPTSGWRRIAGPLFFFRMFGQGAEFLGWIILARRLGAATFGTLSIGFLIARYAGLVADWGALIGGSRTVALDDSTLSSTRALVLLRRRLTVTMVIVFFIVCLTTGNMNIFPVAAVILMLGLSRDWISIGQHLGSRAGIPPLAQGIVLLGVAQFGPRGIPALAIACGYSISALTSIILNRLPRGHIEGHDRNSLDPWMLTAVITNQLISSADVLLVGLLSSATLTGIYSAIYRIPNGWLAAVSIMTTALLPVATRAAASSARFARLHRNAMIVSCAGAAVLITLMPGLYVLTPRVFGPDYRSGLAPLIILLIATAVATICSPLHQLYLAIGSDRVYASFLIAAALCLVLSGLILIPTFGMIGAATSTLFANMQVTLCLTLALHHRKQANRTRSAQIT